MKSNTHPLTRAEALPLIVYHVDDAGSPHEQPVTDRTRLIGWLSYPSPLFVAVNSYLPDCRCDDDEAIELATDLLAERGWFGHADACPPDYVL